MARLTRLSIVNQAHYVILRAIDEITLIPSEEDIGVLFDIFARISHSQHIDFSAYQVPFNRSVASTQGTLETNTLGMVRYGMGGLLLLLSRAALVF